MHQHSLHCSTSQTVWSIIPGPHFELTLLIIGSKAKYCSEEILVVVRVLARFQGSVLAIPRELALFRGFENCSHSKCTGLDTADAGSISTFGIIYWGYCQYCQYFGRQY